MSHSLAYLAGIGAAVLNLNAAEVPVKCTDFDSYGDFLNGYRDAPPQRLGQ